MRVGSVPVSFTSITGALSAEVNLTLLEECQRLGIDPKDTPAVKRAWQDMNAKAAKRLTELDAEAERAREAHKRAVDERRAIEDKFPGPARARRRS